MSGIDWASALVVGAPLGACLQLAWSKISEISDGKWKQKVLPEPQRTVIYFGKSNDGDWNIVVFDDGTTARRLAEYAGSSSMQWEIPGGRYLTWMDARQKAIDDYEKCSREREDQAEFLKLLEQSKSV